MLKTHTAEIEGESACPGEPCETSIPIIIIDFVEILGILCANSIDKTELRPLAAGLFNCNSQS